MPGERPNIVFILVTMSFFSFYIGSQLDGGRNWRDTLRYLPFLLELGAFILFYKAIPNTDVSLRHAFIGGVVATVLFEAAKFGFAAYILNFRSYQLIYGALATVPIFFLWIYLSWLVMLVGAVVAAVLKFRSSPGSKT